MPPRSSESSAPRSGRRRGRAQQPGEGEAPSRSPRKRRHRKKTGEGEGTAPRPSSGKAAGKSAGKKSRRASRPGPRQFHGPSLFDALTRRNALLLWLGLLLLLIALLFYPVADAATRSLTLLLIAGLYLGGLALFWRLAPLRWSLIALPLLLTGYWFLPGRVTFDRPALREETARALSRYQGVRYWPDGENRYGIDGPGLVRRGVIEATFRHGLHTLNPWLLRRSATFWWRDLTTRELVPSARGSARRYTIAKSVRDLNPAVLYPGDFVVTEDRQHTLAYLGDERWLLPDPESGRVLLLHARTAAHPALSAPVSLMRWRILEAPRPNSVYLP